MNRHEIAERQALKLPPRVLEKNRGRIGSRRINEFLLFAFSVGADGIEINRLGQRFTISGFPVQLFETLSIYWTLTMSGIVENGEFVLKPPNTGF